jgi:branched-chain amino acid transport system permease protein
MIAYLSTLFVLVVIAALVGLALNFQWGVAGLPNFGVVGFVALGAYATALLGPHIGWFAAMIGAALLSAAASTALAFLSIRLADDYLAIVTIGFGEVVGILLLNEDWLTGGALGIPNIPRPFTSLVPATQYDAVLLCFALVLLALTFVTLETLVRSPFGRALRALREDPIAAGALGKPVLLLRIKAFAIGGAVMGIAGALHAFYLTYIDPGQFTSIITAYAFMAVILGGRGSNIGLLIGAGTIMTLIEATRFLKDALAVIDGAQLAALRLGLVGIGIMVLLIARPQGLIAEPRKRARDFFGEGDAKSDARPWPLQGAPAVATSQTCQSNISSEES